MPNGIKYSTGATEAGCLRKGNMLISNNTANTGNAFYTGINPPSGGYTIYLNKASGGPSIYCPANDTQLISITNQISVTTNLIKNNNGGNFADGTLAPFNGSYGTLPTVVDISNDKPYNGSTSTKAAKFVAGGGMLIYTDPSPFTMTVGVTYTFSFWYRQTNSNQFYIGFNNQGGSGDMNGNFQSYSAYGYFPNPTQTWQRCSWTFTNVVNKPYFFIYSTNSDAGSECLMTEFTLTEGSMPSGPGLTTAGNCLNYFATQTDKLCANFNYEGIVTNGLVLNLDAGFSPSFATIPSNANSTTVTPWYDLSGNTNNGTLTNGPTFNSANSGSIVFDGVDDYVQVTSPFGNIDWSTRAWSFSSWMKLDTLGDKCLVNLNSSNSSHYIVTNVFYTDQKSYWYFIKNSTAIQTNFTQTTSEFPANQIFHFTMTYNGNGLSSGNIKFYKNGNLLTTIEGGSAGLGNLTGLQIGGTYYPLDGNVYNFLMYDKVLSQSEITQNYNAQKGRFGL